MIINLHSLFKSLSIEKSKHKEYRDFKRHTRILPSGKLVSVAEYHRLMDVKGDEDGGNDKSRDRQETRRNKGVPGEIRPSDGGGKPRIPQNVMANEFIGKWKNEILKIHGENPNKLSFFKEVIKPTGDNDNDRSSIGKETTGDQGLSGEKRDEIRPEGDISEQIADDGWRIEERWDTILRTTSTGEKITLSPFQEKIARIIASILSTWPESAKSFINKRLSDKKPFIAFRNASDIPPELRSVYEDSMGISSDKLGIEIVEGIHQYITPEILRHETLHLLYYSFVQELKKGRKSGGNYADIVQKLVNKPIDDIQTVVMFCFFKDEWYNENIGKNALVELKTDIDKMREAIAIVASEHILKERIGPKYDQTVNLQKDLLSGGIIHGDSLYKISNFLRTDLPKNGQYLTLLWHNWIARKYKNTINESYTINEPVAYAAGKNQELFNQIFSAAQKDFPELFTIDEVKKSMLLKLYDLFKAISRKQQSDSRQLSFFDDAGEVKEQAPQPSQLHPEKVDVKATMRTNPVTGKISPVVQHTATRQKVYRTEHAHSAYKKKALWGEGLYFGLHKDDVADMTTDPNSETYQKPRHDLVTEHELPEGLKLKTIDTENMSNQEFNKMLTGEKLKNQVMKEGYDGIKVLTGRDLNLGGDQIVIYNKEKTGFYGGSVAVKKKEDVSDAKRAELAKKYMSRMHTIEDVYNGKYPVGTVDHHSTLEKAKELGMFTTEVRGIPIYAKTEKDAQPMINYLNHPESKYGSTEFSRLLGYSDKEIENYKKFLIETGQEDYISKPTHPTETPEFKKWFAGSKVVDEKGKPMVVYHGSKSNINTFFPNSHFGTAGQANQLLESVNEALDSDISYSGRKKEAHSDSIYPVYLSIKNPKRVDDVGSNDLWEDEIKQAKKEGYDGIVYSNIEEVDIGEAGGLNPDEDSFPDSYIAFYPNQIKSAIGNKGEYSSHPDITKSLILKVY